ncbi:phosphoribosylaminoimidazole carboxylase [Streptococcus hongkongensis]|nr:phosphoribosylaminoimidazole carboxylase [Streptococcus uberis]
MIKIIVHAYIEETKANAIVEVVFASEYEKAISKKLQDLQEIYPNDYLAVYDLPQDTDLTKLPHYPSVSIGREEFEE